MVYANQNQKSVRYDKGIEYIGTIYKLSTVILWADMLVYLEAVPHVKKLVLFTRDFG
jgi:hypothetical protein